MGRECLVGACCEELMGRECLVGGACPALLVVLVNNPLA